MICKCRRFRRLLYLHTIGSIGRMKSDGGMMSFPKRIHYEHYSYGATHYKCIVTVRANLLSACWEAYALTGPAILVHDVREMLGH